MTNFKDDKALINIPKILVFKLSSDSSDPALIL